MSSWFGGLTFLLQAAVVIVAVIVFSFIDPFGILVSTKLKLKDTPISIESIKEIGELISAEYYGEVISSTMEDVKIQTNSLEDEFSQNLDSLHEKFFNAVEELDIAADDDKLKRNKRAQLRRYFDQNFGLIKKDPWFEQYISAAYENVVNGGTGTFDDKAKISKGDFGKLLVTVLGDEDKMDTLEAFSFKAPLLRGFSQGLTEVKKKQYRKRQLVLLGRGWVKAGFRFNDFSEKNFRYEKETNRIIFIGMQPEILSSTINPWFIPEKGIEGFEFLIVQRKARKDPAILERVKERCLEKLVEKSHEADILEMATKNAQEQLKNLFDLLLDEPLEEVSFYNNVFDYTEEAIKKDTLLSGSEFYMIDRALAQADSLVNNGIIERERVVAFMDVVRSLPYELFDEVKPNKLNPFVSFAYQLGSDGKLKPYDQAKVLSKNPANFQAGAQPAVWNWWYYQGKQLDSASMDYKANLIQLRNYVSAIELDSATITKVEINEANKAKGDSLTTEVNRAFYEEMDKIIPPSLIK